MVRKPSVLRLKGVAIYETPVLDERWLEWLDSKIALLINRDGVDPRDYLGKSYDEYVFTGWLRSVTNTIANRELSKACEQHIKQEDEGKFRCKTCQKLFKATSFVEKHIANKHPDLVKQLEDVRIVHIPPFIFTYFRDATDSLLQ